MLNSHTLGKKMPLTTLIKHQIINVGPTCRSIQDFSCRFWKRTQNSQVRLGSRPRSDGGNCPQNHVCRSAPGLDASKNTSWGNWTQIDAVRGGPWKFNYVLNEIKDFCLWRLNLSTFFDEWGGWFLGQTRVL